MDERWGSRQAHYIFNFVYKNSVEDFSGLLENYVTFYIFFISLCYACGHFLSGIFFHLPLFRTIFSYSPRDLLIDYPDIHRDDAWASHRSSYRRASDNAGESFQGLIERHAALLHFTGHFSAAILFTLFYIAAISIFYRSTDYLLLAVPMAVLLPGIFVHYRQLSMERYRLERSVITMESESDKSAGIKGMQCVILYSSFPDDGNKT